MKHKMVLMLLALVLAASSVQAQKQQKISDAQCRKIFLASDDYQNRRTPEGTPYCEVYWDRDDDPRELLGYVFLKTMSLQEKEVELLIGVDLKGKIVKVNVKEPAVVSDEFLAQFVGRSLSASFEVAKAAEDLLYLPSKLKGNKDNLEISESIAQTVHSVLLSANHSLALGSAK